jgi:hypothetical protein
MLLRQSIIVRVLLASVTRRECRGTTNYSSELRCHTVFGMENPTRPEPWANQSHNPYVFDTGHFRALLEANAKRTLVPDHELQMKITEVGVKGQC